MKALLLDTNIVIDFLRQRPPAVAYVGRMLDDHPTGVFLSTVTVAELYAGVREGQERRILAAFLSLFKLLPVDDTVAELGGLLKRDYQAAFKIDLPDALIAATAQIHDLTLATRNTKHFPMLADVVAPY